MASLVSREGTEATAYQLPPLTPKGLGLAIETVAIALGVASLIVILLRVYARVGVSRLMSRSSGLDDTLAVIGTLSFVAAAVFAVFATRYGLGARDVDLPSPLYQVRAAEYVIYWEVLYLISSCITKCVIGFTCMRLDSRKRFVFPMSVNMSIIVIVTVLALVYLFATCRPLSATWNPSLGTCQEVLGQTTVNYVLFLIQMATDWICVIIPFFIVIGIQMRDLQKLLVICVLGLGVLASIAACFRVPYLKYYDTTQYPGDFLYHIGAINLCSNVECGLGVIACSLPPLHNRFNKFRGDPAHDGQYSFFG